MIAHEVHNIPGTPCATFPSSSCSMPKPEWIPIHKYVSVYWTANFQTLSLEGKPTEYASKLRELYPFSCLLSCLLESNTSQKLRGGILALLPRTSGASSIAPKRFTKAYYILPKFQPQLPHEERYDILLWDYKHRARQSENSIQSIAKRNPV